MDSVDYNYKLDFDQVFARMSPTPPPNARIKQSNLLQSRFLQLPSEIRLQIYKFSLISPSPIIVWSAEFAHGYPKPTHLLSWNRTAMRSSIQNLALGLLRCNTITATESAFIFYHHNTFRFEGDHEYYPAVTFLSILNFNLENLRNLENTVRQPLSAWQSPDGSRHKMSGVNARGLAAHHPHFATPPPGQPYQEGEVDIVDPALETILSLLAKSSNDSVPRRLTLVLDLGSNTIPGIVLIYEEDASLFSMDLPNLLEIWRRSYFVKEGTKNSYGASSLDLIWKAEIDREIFDAKGDLLEDVGWTVVKKQEDERVYTPFRNDASHNEKVDEVIPTIRLWMRRARFAVPIVASDPDPWTRWHERPIGD
ncbi:MAG: hypothetical protein Q9168_006911 [Polycauliona sp. 1 TL-2023]